MRDLIGVSPTAVQYHNESMNFYYGVQPSQIQHLPDQAEFMVVYSPKNGDGWQFVKYRMFGSASGLAVTERRDLTAEEITYFEEQRRLTKPDTGTVSTVDEART